MSTKTTFKRVALVAVASLGFGLLGSTASTATIIASPIGNISGISLAKTSATTSGITNEVVVTATNTYAAITAAGDADGRYVVTAATLLSAPSNGNATVTSANGTLVTCGTTACTQTATLNRMAIFMATGSTIATGATGTALWKFTPAVAGTYVLRVWHDATGAAATGDGIYTVGETYQDLTITVGTANAALSDFELSNSTTAGVNDSLTGVRVSSVSATVIRPSGRVGVHGAFQPRFLLTRNGGATAANAGAANNTLSANLNYTVTNPAGTAVTLVGTIGSTTATTEQYVAGSATAIADVGTLGGAQSSATHVAGDQMGSFVFFPTATAGTYTITVWHDQNRDDLVSPGEATAQSTVTVVADALPSIVMTVTGNTTPALSANSGQGQILKICLLNGTAAATLGVSETLTVSGDANTIFDNQSTMTTSGANAGLLGVTDTNAATLAFTAANFNSAGCAYANVGNTTAGGGTYPLTAAIAGGTGAGATGSVNHSVVDTTTYPVAATSALHGGFGSAITNPNTPSVSGATSGVLGAAIAAATGARSATWTIKRSTAQTVTAKMVVGANASASYTAVVNDTLGAITGWKGSSYGLVKTTGTTVTAATAVSFSVAMPALSSSQTSAAALVVAGRNATGDGASGTTITITNAVAAATTTYINAAQDASTASVRAGVASSNKITGTVRDQFGNVLPNISVATVIVGRNAATVVPTLLSDANGQFSYTLADVYTATLLTTDVVTMTPAGVTTAGAFTINYAAYLPAATITMTTADSANATATGIAGGIKTDISSADGAEAGAVNVRAVLKDVNGATLPAGIPVTFSVAGTGVAILSTHVTLYTDATGTVTSQVYGWVNGDRVVTATAGAVTATGTYYFRQGGTESETRTIKATATGNVVQATVTDRFGNPIKAASVTATRVGTGTFNGTSSITGVTDAAGVVEFVLTGGTADVTVGFSSSTYGQTYATKGYTDAGITALTAFKAGTTVLAEEGVGASFDAAGVNSVKVLAVTDTATLDASTAAGDAAAEATDAANAATDAANAAAEAADAATAAAQDAADAVAALSVQVSEQIAELKAQNDSLRKQLIALTNLIIKIQKKVKA